MAIEQKVASLQRAFPSAEVRKIGPRLLVRHHLAVGPQISEETAPQLLKGISQLGGPPDIIFMTNRLSNRRLTDPSDQRERVFYTSMRVKDGTVHQIRSTESFQENIKSHSKIATNNPSIRSVDGFIEVDEKNIHYVLTPREEPQEKKSSVSVWKELVRKMVTDRLELSDRILLTLSLTENDLSSNIVTASYLDESISIVLDLTASEGLTNAFEDPNIMQFVDLRDIQRLPKSVAKPLADF